MASQATASEWTEMVIMKLRMSAQSMAKTDGRALHPLWSAVLPVYTPLTSKPSMMTLMDVMVKDPQPKVAYLLHTTAIAKLARKGHYILRQNS